MQWFQNFTSFAYKYCDVSAYKRSANKKNGFFRKCLHSRMTAKMGKFVCDVYSDLTAGMVVFLCNLKFSEPGMIPNSVLIKT